MTRAAKRDVDREVLRESWEKQAAGMGFDAKALAADALGREAGRDAGTGPGLQPAAGPDAASEATTRAGGRDAARLDIPAADGGTAGYLPDREGGTEAAPESERADPASRAAAAVEWAVAHLSEREAVFARTDLLAAALAWSPGAAAIGDVEREVAAVRDGRVTFRLEDGRMLDLAPGDPQIRHVDRAWASTVHAFQGRTVDTVIAAMEANHPHLTTQKSFYVEISRARDRAELVTDDKAALKEQLEAATGERIAALEAVEADRAKGREAGADAGRSAEREGGLSRSRDPDRVSEPAMEQSRGSKGVDRDLGL